MAERFRVERKPDPPWDWLVIDTETGETVRSFGLRTNWIDGKRGKPYGPEAAAREIARRMNAESEGGER